MNNNSGKIKKIKVSSLKTPSSEEILNIKQIEIDCRLSEWSLLDYQTESEREDSIFLVGKSEENIVAFLIARFSKNFTETESEADLLNFGVSKSFQSRGVGDRLFKRLSEELCKEKIKTIWLEVRKSNENAVRFYLRRNFKIIQTRKNFYLSPVEDALVLKLDL